MYDVCMKFPWRLWIEEHCAHMVAAVLLSPLAALRLCPQL